MINKLEYKFENSFDKHKGFEVPIMYIHTYPDPLPIDCFLDSEIDSLSQKYVQEIVKNLEEVKKGKRDKEIFGFETIAIWCYMKWKWYYGEKYPDTEVTITYDYADAYIVTSLKIDDILKMMTDWRDYIDAWEKETGKIKK